MRFKRFLAVGCTHGSFMDQHAAEAVLKFSKIWKPDVKIHLGDVCDYAAFRGGARGTSDEAAMIGPDIQAGAEFIRRFGPTDVLIGNHDVRVWKLADHPNAVIAHAAACCRNEFLTACERARVKRVVDHYDINRSWIEYGGTKFLHGWMYSESAIRDHAEHFGNCVIAHLHRVGSEPARRSDHAVAHCVGTLANVPALDYASTRRATARWSHGFAWGEFNDHECHVNLSRCDAGQAVNWRLPL